MFVFDLPAVAHLPGFSACAAGFLAAALPLKLGVGVAEDMKLLARCLHVLTLLPVNLRSKATCSLLRRTPHILLCEVCKQG